jgi:hypothetical protein
MISACPWRLIQQFTKPGPDLQHNLPVLLQFIC